ncbi:MAG: peptidoglycan DD-metalloendopeptidase family protein [Cyanobacteria bacterium J06639_14]
MPKIFLSTTLVTTLGLIAAHSLLAAHAVEGAENFVGDDSVDVPVRQMPSVETAPQPTNYAPVNSPSSSSPTVVTPTTAAEPSFSHSPKREPAKETVKPKASLSSELPWSTSTVAESSIQYPEVSNEEVSQPTERSRVNKDKAVNPPSEHASSTQAIQQSSEAKPRRSTAVTPANREKSKTLTKPRSRQPKQTKKKVAAKVAAKIRQSSRQTAQLSARPLQTTINPPLAAVATEQPQQYSIQRGDNLHKIAQKLGTTVEALIAANDLENPDKIDVGAVLQLPAAEPSSATSAATSPQVRSNQRASTSSRRTDTVEQQNNDVGQLRLAAQQRPPADEVITPSVAASVLLPEPELVSWHNRHVDVESPLLPDADEQLPQIPEDLTQYVWPTQGTLTSGYGWRWGRMHRGVDIAAPIGTPVIAAAAGVVESASWNNGGYGNLVQIRHADGSLTRYAHNHRLLVSTGDEVTQGQLIAEVGSTGYSTGPHLHFEIHQPDGNAVNPLEHLIVANP